MNKRITGALNSRGFSASLQNHCLPPPTHFTYEGVFNELRYHVGPATDQLLDLHHEYARFQFAESKFDSKVHDYLALFLKSRADGKPRDEKIRLNSVICLDISGSMNIPLEGAKTRLSLCIEAIKMFISKLSPEDSVAMTTFDHQAHLIFEPVLKKDISSNVFNQLQSIKAGGNNDLMGGFNLSKQLLLQQTTNHSPSHQNRIIILSDVCDQSIYQGIEAIKKAADEHIHLTIIGVSNEFDSKPCELLKDTPGFNYFCAVNQEDILKYTFETFDYTFFPSAHDITITIHSDDIKQIEVFGSPNPRLEKLQPFPQQQTTQNSSFLVTQIQSCFPSEIQVDKSQIYTVGGLILVRINRKSQGSSFRGELNLTYSDLLGQKYQQSYNLSYDFHPEEQFLSSQALHEALCGFSYTSEIKNILQASLSLKKSEVYSIYYEAICSLEGLCPKRKLEQYKKLKNIVQGSNSLEKEEQRSEGSKVQTLKQKAKLS